MKVLCATLFKSGVHSLCRSLCKSANVTSPTVVHSCERNALNRLFAVGMLALWAFWRKKKAALVTFLPIFNSVTLNFEAISLFGNFIKTDKYWR